jgi:hypothetical protein
MTPLRHLVRRNDLVAIGWIVLQNSLSGVRANFSRGAGAFARKPWRGSLKQSDFPPASFVSSLQGIVLPKIHFDGKIAKFSRTFIFEFCNTIPLITDAKAGDWRGGSGQKRTPALQHSSGEGT